MSKLKTLDEARGMTTEHRTQNPSATQAHTFNAEHVLSVLQQPGCTGMRIYYGMEGAVVKPIIVGVNAADEDMLHSSAMIVSDPRPCPPDCAKPSILNS